MCEKRTDKLQIIAIYFLRRV